MSPKTSFCLRTHLRRLLDQPSGPPLQSRPRSTANQADNIELPKQLRWPLTKANSPPLWKRHGRPEMPPIAIIPLVEWDLLIPLHFRLALRRELCPYIHCRGCQCGKKSGRVQCMCIECTFSHGVVALHRYTPCVVLMEKGGASVSGSQLPATRGSGGGVGKEE